MKFGVHLICGEKTESIWGADTCGGEYSTAPVSVPVHTVQHQYIQYSIQMANSQDPIMALPARRKKYEASFKLKVVNFAMEHNNCAAARQYGVTEKMVCDWKAN